MLYHHRPLILGYLVALLAIVSLSATYGSAQISRSSKPVNFDGGFSQSAPAIAMHAKNWDFDPDCYDKLDRGRALGDQGKYLESYDSLKQFVEECAVQPFSQRAFFLQTANVTSLSEDNKEYWVDYREWLKKVLYYSPDTSYYCADAMEINSTFHYFPGRGFDVNGALAVVKYLFESGKCPKDSAWYFSTWGPTREAQLKHWQDTVTNPEATPIDTTLPSLEDLGLGILRGLNGGVGREERLKLEWLAVPNPFMDQVSVEMNAPHPGIVRIELFDVLGRSVGQRIERYVEKGATSLKYPITGLDPGSYLLRVEFDGWQVRTQRIQKR